MLDECNRLKKQRNIPLHEQHQNKHQLNSFWYENSLLTEEDASKRDNIN